MRTSLNEIKIIEGFLSGALSAEECLLLEAKMTLNPELRDKLKLQREVTAQVQAYGRKQLRAEIEAVHHTLFTRPAHISFRQKVLGLFNRK